MELTTMKKTLPIILAAMILLAVILPVSAVEPTIVYPQEGDLCRPYGIIIILKEEYSGYNLIYDASDFPEIPVVEYKSLTIPLPEYANDPNSSFKQISLLIYDEASGFTMEEAMNRLALNPMIEYIGPDWVISIGDESVPNARDVIQLMKICLDSSDLSESELKNIDQNGDGKLNARDVIVLMKIVLENN